MESSTGTASLSLAARKRNRNRAEADTATTPTTQTTTTLSRNALSPLRDNNQENHPHDPLRCRRYRHRHRRPNQQETKNHANNSDSDNEEDNDNKKNNKQDSTTKRIDFKPQEQQKARFDKLLHDFKAACVIISAAEKSSQIKSKSFSWSSSPLQSAIVNASLKLKLSKSTDIGSGSGDCDSLVLLDDYALVLLNQCCSYWIPQATTLVNSDNTTCAENEKNKQQEQKSLQQALLLVSIHCLRAYSLLLSSLSNCNEIKVEQLLKALYHAVQTCCCCCCCYCSTAEQSTHLFAWAWQAMHLILLKSQFASTFSSSNDNSSSNNVPWFGTTEATTTSNVLPGIFAIPKNSENNAPSFSVTARLNLTGTKVSTIVVQACLAIIKFWFQQCAQDKDEPKVARQIVDSWNDVFGVRGQDSMSFSSSSNNNPRHLLHEWAIQLASHVALPWMQMLMLYDLDSVEEAILALSKKLHRVLWDQAFEKTFLSPQQVLELRGQAICILLLSSSNSQNSADNNDRFTHVLRSKGIWENACYLAWKAAVLYQQDVSSSSFQQKEATASETTAADPKQVLIRFHMRIGPVLDRHAAGLLPLPYLEYCGYRALHGGGAIHISFSNNVNDDNPFTTHNKCILQTLFLALVCKQEIARGKKKKIDDAPSNKPALSMMVDNLARIFQLLLENDGSCRIPIPEQDGDYWKRILKLFHSVSLHLAIYDALTSHQQEQVQTTMDSTVLQAASRLSASCVGPIYLRAIMKQQDTDNSGYWEHYTESMIRGVSGLEHLLREKYVTGVSNLRRQSDHLMMQTTNVLLDHGAPPICVEKVAKNLYKHGSKRMESVGISGLEKYAAAPLLLSIRLFSHLKPSPAFQLSTRWTHLATLFKSLAGAGQQHYEQGRSFLELLATFSALREHAKDTAAADHNDYEKNEVQILKYLSLKCHGNIPVVVSEGGGGGDVFDMEQDADKTRESLICRILAAAPSGYSNAHSLLFMTATADSLPQSGSGGGINNPDDSICSYAHVAAAPETSSLDMKILIQGILEHLSSSSSPATSLCDWLASNFGASFTLSSLCRLFFFEEHDQTSYQYFKTRLSLAQRMAVQIASLVDKNPNDGEDKEEDEYTLFLRDEQVRIGLETARYLHGIILSKGEHKDKGGGCARDVAVALFYVALSASAISFRSVVQPGSWNWNKARSRSSNGMALAKEYARFAMNHLEEQQHEENEDEFMGILTHGFFRAMIQFYHLRLECNGIIQNLSDYPQQDSGDDEQIIWLCRQWLDNIDSEISPPSSSSAQAGSNSWMHRCILSYLGHYSEWLWYCGNNLAALELAMMSFKLCHRLGLGLPLLLSMKTRALSFAHQNSAVLRDNVILSSSEEKLHFPSSEKQIEIQAYRIRHELLLTSHPVAIEAFGTKLQSLLSLVSGDSEKDASSWAKSCVLLALTDVSEYQGDYARALEYTGQVIQHCQDLASSSSGIDVSIYLLCSRELACLETMANLYARLGDWKRADLYAKQSARHVYIELDTATRMMTQRERQIQRLWSSLKSRREPIPNLSGKDVTEMEDDNLLETVKPMDLELQNVLCALERMRMFECAVVPSESWLDAFEMAKDSFGSFCDRECVNELAQGLPADISPLAFYELLLGEAKAGFSQHGLCLYDHRQDRIMGVCTRLAEEPSVPPTCRAEGLYLLGLLEIFNARRSGALYQLWNDRSNRSHVETNKSVDGNEGAVGKARLHLRSALKYAGPASTVLTRNILRSLALVAGPENGKAGVDASSTHALLHLSMGATYRMNIVRALSQDDNDNDSKPDRKSGGLTVREAFDLLDTPPFLEHLHDQRVKMFFQHLARLAPKSWRFVATCLCPTGELLLSSWENNGGQGGAGVCFSVCIFPDIEDGRIYDTLLSPLDRILEKSRQHMKDTKANPPETPEERAAWWRTRRALDSDLGQLLEYVENDLFGVPSIQQGLFGEKSSRSRASEGSASNASSLPLMDLSTDFAALSIGPDMVENYDEDTTVDRTKYQSWKVPELRDKLKELGYSTKELRNVRKADLIDMLVDRLMEEEENVTQSQDKESDEPESETQRERSLEKDAIFVSPPTTTILVLDEHLQRFPFESLASFRGNEVCRMPTIAFALGKLCEINGDVRLLSINPDCTSFVLDPESNLPATRERIETALRSMTVYKESMWEGVVGQMPSHQFMVRGLSQDRGLFLYYGHGDAKVCFSSVKVRKMLEPNDSGMSRRIQSSIVLMGCSSGKLESVIREGQGYTEEQFLPYLPEGMAISYLAAGAPCVVGNLWDVTDTDIDRFAVKSMEIFLEDKDNEKSLAESIALARSTCKLVYLTGCAPVCYGLPVRTA